MAASPGIAEPPESSDTHSSPHPPSSPELHPTQDNPSLTTVAPSEMPNPATPVPPPPAEESTVEHSEADLLYPTPINEVEQPLSHPPQQAAPSASSAFEASPTEKLASPAPHPEEAALEVSHEVTASAPSPSSSPSPQIVGDSLEDAPQPSPPPCTPPATAAHTSTDSSSIEEIAMAYPCQEEAVRPSPMPESMDAYSRTPTAPLMPPVESRPKGLLPQQQQQPCPPSPEMAFTPCESLEPVQTLPLQPCHPVECTDASPDATVDEVVEGKLEIAASSLPVPEAGDGHKDITSLVLPALDIGSEEMLSQQQRQPLCPEMVPGRGENSKYAHPPQPPPLPESTRGWSNALTNEASAVASEEATVALQFGAERSSQEPVQTPMTSRMEPEPCSPETAPPGFEDFKSQWMPLPPPIPPAESAHNVARVAASSPVGVMCDVATESLPALEAMGVEMDTPPGLLSPLKSGAEGRSQQPLLRSCSPLVEAAPCSPDMPPPGFENCKSSWLPLPTIPPVVETTYALLDVASANTVAFMEKASFVSALESTDVETDTEQCRLSPLEGGTASSLQGPLPISPSPKMQSAPCSPDTSPPGFKKAIYVTSKEAPQSSSLDAPPSGSETGKSLPLEHTLVPSHVAEHTVCALGMVPSGSENVESSQLPQLPAVDLTLDETPDALVDAGTKTVTTEDACNPKPVTGGKEEANGSMLRPALENDGEDPLPHLEQHASSDIAPTSAEIAPTSFENSESSPQTSPCLAETDPSAQASATMLEIVKSDKTSLPLSPLQATGTDMESATLQHSPLKNEESSLAQSEQHPSSTCSCSPEVAPPGFENLESSEQLPPPPPLSAKFAGDFTEIGQMVCGYCRQLLAYPKGSVHVQCFGCGTINLVLEAL
nr:unnamed protein product [Digitaria exilis]